MPERNFENRTLYHGDNLDFLKGINSGTVNLIATDPPFNKSRDFHATPDKLAAGASFTDRWRWDEDIHQEWIDEIKDDYPGVWQAIENGRINHSPSMAAFLCWLGVRLIQMHRVLTDNGSMYLHIDNTAHAYIKCLMDAIFGQRNFRNDVVWQRTYSHNDPKRYGRITDTLLFYTKGDSYTWNTQYLPYSEDYVNKFFRSADERGKFQSVTLTGPGVSDGASGGRWRGYSPTDSGRTWSVPRRIVQQIAGDAGHQLSINERLDLLDAHGYIYWPPNGVAPRFKQYLHEMPGVPVQNLWTDVDRLSAHAKERTGYPTQKPLALYERIIKSSSNPGDFVLDPFCGCATTPIAAERLGRQWLGMDIWPGAYNVVKERLESIGLTSDAANDTRLITLGDIIYTKTSPVRTDETDDDPDVPDLVLRPTRVKAEWEKLTHADMRDILAKAQATGDNIVCAGCGIALPLRYMQLDHNLPRKDGGENVITNRILLCGPCNLTKSANLTLSGLRNLNRREGYMTDRDMAELSSSKARDAAERCRIEIK